MNLIRNARMVKGYSQEQMADLMGISQSQYSRMESTGSGLDMKRIKDLSRLLQVDIVDLVPLTQHGHPGMEALMERINKLEKENSLLEMKTGAALFEVGRLKNMVLSLANAFDEKDYTAFHQKLQTYVKELEQQL